MRRLPDWAKAEAKGMKVGAYAWKNANGTYSVRSATRPGLKHDQMPVYLPTGAIRIECGCESGEASPTALVPCWHATRVGRRLEREKVAVRGKHGWYLRDPEQQVIASDPFAGERDQRGLTDDPFNIPDVAA